MSLFSRKPKDELILILDIQSSVVRGSLVLMHPAKIPEIIFSHERALPYRQDAGSSYLIKAALKAVNETVTESLHFLSVNANALPDENVIPRKIHSVHYALSSPWIISQAKTISTSFTRNTEITEGLIKDIIGKQRIELTIEPNDRIATVEEKIFDVKLNGYSTGAWHGQEAKDIQISFVSSVAGTVMLDRFREACAAAVPEKRVHFHSALLLQTMGMRLTMPDRASFTLIHPHGELTDVVVVDHSTCTFFGSFPMGTQTIVRKVSKAAHVDIQTADSLLTMYFANNLDAAKKRLIEPIIENIAKGWVSEYDRLFNDEESSTSPARRSAILFSLKHQDFYISSFITAHTEARVESLTFDELTPHVAFNPQVERLRVTGLHAIALHSIHS